MTRLLAGAAAMGTLLLASASAVADAQSPAATPQVLDVTALATQSKTVEIAEDALHTALVKGTPEGVVFSAALDLSGGATALAWSECSKTACRGSVALLSGGGEHPKLVKRAALVAPAKVFFADGFAFEPPALADLDGDGTAEIILRYRASEPPRAALGSLSHDYVAVYSPKDLSLIFSHELRRAGGDSEDSCQWSLERSGDRLIASGQCNVAACLGSTPPTGCKPTRKLVETWRKASGHKCYVRVANAPTARAARAAMTPTASSGR